MTIEELEALHRPKKSLTRLTDFRDSRRGGRDSGVYERVGPNGLAYYVTVTEDGREVPIDEWTYFGYGDYY